MSFVNLLVVLPTILSSVSSNLNTPARAVADAEYAFAKTSRETNTVNAFQKFLADDAVMFRQGSAVNGRDLWAERKPDSTLLNWWPVVADAAGAGDLGYTTGPYQFFNRRSDTVPVGNGYYSTIWKRQQNGEWKIKVDLGVSLEAIQKLPSELVLIDASNEKTSGATEISEIDSRCNAALNQHSVSVDKNFLATVFRVHRPKVGPAVNEINSVLRAETKMRFTFQTIAGEISSSGDLAYSYGNVTRSENGSPRAANYLRVWKMQNREWRIVLDVVTEG